MLYDQFSTFTLGFPSLHGWTMTESMQSYNFEALSPKVSLQAVGLASGSQTLRRNLDHQSSRGVPFAIGGAKEASHVPHEHARFSKLYLKLRSETLTLGMAS